MSQDKRTVSTDALESLGMIHTRQEYRDAIHLAVEPVEAGERLSPSDHIYLKDGKAYSRPGSNIIIETLGIVDPFLDKSVNKGEKFWLVVYPRKITSLRHVWSHPAFSETVDTPAIDVVTEPSIDTAKQKAYEWIKDYADRLNSEDDDEYYSKVTAEELISYGTDYFTDEKNGRYPDYLEKGGLLEGVSTSDQFWDQLEIYLGKPINENFRGNFFSCSC